MKRKIYKTLKILIISVLALFILLALTVFVLIRIPFIQEQIVKKTENSISKSLKTEVKIKGIYIDHFTRLVIDEFYIADSKKDTLLYSKQIKIKITSFGFSTNTLTSNRLFINNMRLKFERDSTNKTNFDFLFVKSDEKKNQSLNLILQNLEMSNSKLYYNDNGKIYVADISFLKLNKLRTKPNEIFLNIDKLNTTLNNTFKIENLQAVVNIGKSEINAPYFTMKYNNSELRLREIKISKDFKNFYKKPFSIDIKRGTEICLKDFAFINNKFVQLPTFKIKGQIKNDSKKIVCEEFSIKQEAQNNHLITSFVIENPEDIYNSTLMFEIKSLYSDTTLFSKILPLLKNKNAVKYLSKIKELDFKGEAKGVPSNTIVTGFLKSNVGNCIINTNIKKNGNDYFVISKGIFDNVNLKTIANVPIQNFNFILDANLTINKDTNYYGNIGLLVKSMDYNKLIFEKIAVNLKFNRKVYDLSIVSNDRKAELSLKSHIDASKKQKTSEISGYVKNINLAAIANINNIENISCKIYSVINYIDENNLKVNLNLENIYLKNKEKTLKIEQFNALSTKNEQFYNIYLSSKYINATVSGRFELYNVVDILKNNILSYIPNYKEVPKLSKGLDQNISFNVKVSNPTEINDFLQVVKLSDKSTLSGNINFQQKVFNINLNISKLSMNNNQLNNIVLKTKITNDGLLNININADELIFNKNEIFKTSKIVINSNNKVADIKIKWLDTRSKESFVASNIRLLKGTDDKIELKFNKSNIFINDSIWNIANSSIIIDTSALKVNNFKIFSKEKNISINGELSKNKDAKLTISSENIPLKYKDSKTNVNSSINMTVELYDFSNFKNLKINSDIILKSTMLNQHDFGDIFIRCFWDMKNEKIKGKIVNNCRTNKIEIEGYYTDKIGFDIDGELSHFPFPAITPYVGAIEFEGVFGGKIKLRGNKFKPILSGNIETENAFAKVVYTNVKYKIADKASLSFENSNLFMNEIDLFDDNGNTLLLNGYVKHNNMKDFVFLVDVKSDQALAIDLPEQANKGYFGKIYGTANVIVKGDKLSTTVNVNADVDENTCVYVPLNKQNTDKLGFITFVKPTKEINIPKLSALTKINVSLNIKPTAEIHISTGKVGKDMLTVRGNSQLTIKSDEIGNLQLFGNYIATEGIYSFNLANIPIKKFNLKSGSIIKFTGDMAETTMDLKALYSLNRVDIGDLWADFESKKMPVDCYLNAKGKILEPEVNFSIDIPESSYDADLIKSKLNNLSVSELNSQVFYLLLMLRFKPIVTTNEMNTQKFSPKNSATELISGQLNNVIAEISDKIDIGFQYKDGNDVNPDQLKMALSTHIDFLKRNRLKFTVITSTDMQDIKNSTNQTNSKSATNIEEMNVEYKPTSNIGFKVTNKVNDSYSITPDKTEQVQKVGFSYEKNFNSISDLNPFKSNKKKIKKNITKDTIKKIIKPKQVVVDTTKAK